MADLTAFTSFADDIRDETSGKCTIVGEYGSDIQIESPTPSTFTIHAYTRIIGPITTQIKYINIDFSLQGEIFRRIKIPNKALADRMDQHAAEIEMIQRAAGDGVQIRDVTLARGWIDLAVPLTTPVAILSVVADIGYGLIPAGSIPVQWIPPGTKRAVPVPIEVETFSSLPPNRPLPV